MVSSKVQFMGVAPYRKRVSKNINDEAFTAINLAVNTHYR
jgi:hypothetical protein